MTINNDIFKKFSNYNAFTYRDVELFLKSKKGKEKNIARIISYMKSKGILHSLRKGVYTFNADPMVSGFAYSPFYYGLLSSLTIRDLWTQNSRPDILTIKKVRSSRVSIFDDRNDIVFVHHIPARYFFGFDLVKYGRLNVPVSDFEKTLIDLFYYKVRLSVQNYGELLKAIDKRKLNGYLKKYDSHTAKVVNNFVKKYKPLADSGKLENKY